MRVKMPTTCNIIVKIKWNNSSEAYVLWLAYSKCSIKGNYYSIYWMILAVGTLCLYLTSVSFRELIIWKMTLNSSTQLVKVETIEHGRPLCQKTDMKGARYFCLGAATLFIDWELVLTQVIQGVEEEDIDLRVQSYIFIAHSIRYLDGIGFWVSRVPIQSLHYVE